MSSTQVAGRSGAGVYAYPLRDLLEPVESGIKFTEAGEANPEGLLIFTNRIFAGSTMKNNERGPRLLKTASEY